MASVSFRIGLALIALLSAVVMTGCGGSISSVGNVIDTGPKITSVTPSSIPTSGDVTLTVVGSGFKSNGTLQSAEFVTGTALVPVSMYQIGVENVTINSDTSATVYVPADSYGTSPPIPLASFAYQQSNISLAFVYSSGINGYAQSPVVSI